MRTEYLPFSPPHIGNDEIDEVAATLRSDWITTGPRTRRFEKEFAAFLGASGCLAVSSCTAALHLALIALGIGSGDAVLTTPLTFCSGVHVIEHMGARPVLVDVEPDTLNIDPDKLREQVRNLGRRGGLRPRALLPVHLYGHPCEMSALFQIARENELAIIEDAAHALPAKYEGRMIGAPEPRAGVPILTCFSFYATKNMTTGEGGMLAGPPDTIETARVWSLHGMSRDAWKRYGAGGSWRYDVLHPGFKYNLSDIQSAIGLRQLLRLPALHARRKEIASRYSDAFARIDALQIPTARPNVDHAWHLYTLRLRLERLSLSRDEFIEELAARKIASSVHFIPIHLHRYYREKYKYEPQDFPVAYREYQKMVSLPLYTRMTDQDVADVIEAVCAIAKKHALMRHHAAGCGNAQAAVPFPASRAAGSLFQRVFDGTCSLSGLIFLAPVFALIALAIKLDDGGPVLYRQCRVGKNFRLFRLLKFRSMVVSAEAGSQLTAQDDARVTRIGRFLRKHKLDELPQLVNVLLGEMALVGVRPQVPQFVEAYRSEYEELLQVPPGITDPASLRFLNEEEVFGKGSIEEQYVKRILPEKLKISIAYCRSRTLVADIKVLLRTVLRLETAAVRRSSERMALTLDPLSKDFSRHP